MENQPNNKATPEENLIPSEKIPQDVQTQPREVRDPDARGPEESGYTIDGGL